MCRSGDVCEVTVNVADFFGDRKGNMEINTSAPWEVGYHASNGGGIAELKWIRVPVGTHPRILRHHTNMYSIFSSEKHKHGTRGAALWAIHTKTDFDFSGFNISHCLDCLMWMQAPVSFPIVLEREVGHLDMSLLKRDSVWLKLSVFNVTDREEILSEMTTSLEYCYEPIGDV